MTVVCLGARVIKIDLEPRTTLDAPKSNLASAIM